MVTHSQDNNVFSLSLFSPPLGPCCCLVNSPPPTSSSCLVIRLGPVLLRAFLGGPTFQKITFSSSPSSCGCKERKGRNHHLVSLIHCVLCSLSLCSLKHKRRNINGGKWGGERGFFFNVTPSCSLLFLLRGGAQLKGTEETCGVWVGVCVCVCVERAEERTVLWLSLSLSLSFLHAPEEEGDQEEEEEEE